MSTMPFGSDQVWNECHAGAISASASSTIQFQVWPGWGLVLYNSAGGIEVLPGHFVLFSPQLKPKTICDLLPLLQRRQVACGFNVADIHCFQNVYVVGNFSDDQLLPLVQAGINVQRVTGASTKARLAKLELLLNG